MCVVGIQAVKLCNGKKRTLRTDSARWMNMVIDGTKKYENNSDYLRNNVKEMGNLLRKINLDCYSHTLHK